MASFKILNWAKFGEQCTKMLMQSNKQVSLLSGYCTPKLIEKQKKQCKQKSTYQACSPSGVKENQIRYDKTTAMYVPKHCKSALKQYYSRPPVKEQTYGKKLRGGSGASTPISDLKIHKLKCRELMFEEDNKLVQKSQNRTQIHSYRSSVTNNY